MSRATIASSVSPSAAVSVSSASRRGGAAGVCAAVVCANVGSTTGAPERAAAAPTTPTCLNRLRRETCRLSSDPSGMTSSLFVAVNASRLFQGRRAQSLYCAVSKSSFLRWDRPACGRNGAIKRLRPTAVIRSIGHDVLPIRGSNASRLFQDLSKSNAFERILPCVGETLCRFWGGIAEGTRMCVNHRSAREAHCPMIERLGGAERTECRRERKMHAIRRFHLSTVAASAAVLGLAALVAGPAQLGAQQAPTQAVAIDNDDIGGVVRGPNGPEAGVWVIAETTELPTKFARMVVTDDQGRYVIPDLPNASYQV